MVRSNVPSVSVSLLVILNVTGCPWLVLVLSSVATGGSLTVVIVISVLPDTVVVPSLTL